MPSSRPPGLPPGRPQSLLLLPVKRSVLEFYVNKMQDSEESGKYVYVDRRLAAVNPPRNAIFLQMFRQLRDTSIGRLRQDEQAWTVRFRQEGAEDAGGPYRESMALLGADLSSGVLPLLVPCPNAREGHGDNREKVLPNPACRSAEELQMFRFIGRVRTLARTGREGRATDGWEGRNAGGWEGRNGRDVWEGRIELGITRKLMTALLVLPSSLLPVPCFLCQLIGLAVFTSTSFDIDLPSLVWKALVLSKPDESDLEVRRWGLVTRPFVPSLALNPRGPRRARCSATWGPDGALFCSCCAETRGCVLDVQAFDLRFVQTTLTTLRGTVRASRGPWRMLAPSEGLIHGHRGSAGIRTQNRARAHRPGRGELWQRNLQHVHGDDRGRARGAPDAWRRGHSDHVGQPPRLRPHGYASAAASSPTRAHARSPCARLLRVWHQRSTTACTSLTSKSRRCARASSRCCHGLRSCCSPGRYERVWRNEAWAWRRGARVWRRPTLSSSP